ncbi:hypothetical protein K7X08_019878 [Anisodus acutangulus]|uniref:GPI mannosyltransferase 1 n=1 Tax=Anisodus acutangulus TaxID=402998 RepID=A0A9Q1MSD2_9SOLA|nr:hypothetical protein K7X08_019878 [Anisodus acutangulus]
MVTVNLKSLLISSAFLRVFLIVYGEWQDIHMEVRYTDVYYLVFSDAAALVATGKSPYERSTYRYSPLIAFLLVPNSFIHPSWGKFIFSASDLLVGFLINAILNLRGVPEKFCTYSVMVWLLNPFTFTIGTRGNCEPIICAIILWIIICLMKGRLVQAAFWYGLVVHMRIYPIIYALPVILVLNPLFFQYGTKPALVNWSSRKSKSQQTSSCKNLMDPCCICNFLTSLFTWRRIMFGLISGAMFFLLTGVFFFLYGWDFLHEALLYHLTRTDPRHNFSIYLYHIYLHYERELSNLEKLVSFLPQIMVQLVLVMTTQCFVWFFCLLPLILPWTNMKLSGKGLVCYSWLQILSFLSILSSSAHTVQSSNSHLVPLQRNMSNRDEESQIIYLLIQWGESLELL